MRDCLGMLKNWYVVNRETGEIVKIGSVESKG